MKLHASVIEKLIYLMQTYGGYENEKKLRAHLDNVDLTVYERKTGKQDMVLVLTEDYVKNLSQKK